MENKDKGGVTALRKQLLANGYTPIRNRDKATYMSGWPTLEVTEDVIDSWSRMGRDKATGIRVENDLAVIDIDIGDDEMVTALANAILDTCPQLDDAAVPLLIRSSGKEKEAWFVRTDEPFGRIHSRRWVKPGCTADDGTHHVEIFGGASPRQFGAFGPHTVERDGTVTRSYAWRDASPLDTPLDQLPVLTKQQFFAIADKAEELFRAAGWEPVQRTTVGENVAERVYDLTDELAFDVHEGEAGVTLSRLRELAKVEEGLRCSASWLEGPDPRRSPDRCLVSLTRAGHVAIWDSATGVTHVEAAAKPVDYGPEIDRVSERLQELAERRRLKLRAEDDFPVTVSKLLQLYALCPTQPKQVVPLWARDVEDGYKLADFRTMMLPKAIEELGPRGGVRRVNPADAWSSSDRRITVHGMRMRPDKPRPTYEEDGHTWVNVYQPPHHTAPPEGLHAFLLFMEHLFPDPRERDWFLDWLAFKYRRPDIPGPGVVLVAKKQGAGRGTLFGLLRQVFGSAHIRKVDGSTLTGDGGQSQYNTWMAGTTIVLIDELFNAGTGAHLWQRKKAYDRIKGLIDPAAREVEIIRKTQNNFATQTFTSFLMATNNLNALPLDEDDRRICVLTNGGPLGASAAATVLDAYRDGAGFTDGFAAAVAGFLQERDTSEYNPYSPPPLFDGKINMIFQNRTDAAEAAEQALLEMPGDFVTRNAFVERVRVIMGEGDHKNMQAEARERIDRSDWVFLGRVKVKDNGSKADVWARDAAAAARWAATPLADREALLKPNNDARLRATEASIKALEMKLQVVRGGGSGGQ